MAQEKKERAWYIAQSYSGKEDLVKTNLINRIKSYDMEDQIFQVITPEEIVIEKKEDAKTHTIVEKEKRIKIYPSYVFVEMIDNDKTWYIVRNTPGVTGILGSSGNKERPTPVKESEMNAILKKAGLLKAPTVSYKVDDQVTVIAGSYKDFTGIVKSFDLEKNEAVVILEMFNREVEVDLKADEIDVIK